MGWLKAVGKGILWIVKNPTVREIVVSVVAQKIAEKNQQKAGDQFEQAARVLAKANVELDAAPRVVVENR